MNFFCFQTNLQNELSTEKERRKSLIQGGLLKGALRDVHLWNSFVFRDPTWMNLPAAMRYYIEEKLNIRNLSAHPDLEDSDD